MGCVIFFYKCNEFCNPIYVNHMYSFLQFHLFVYILVSCLFTFLQIELDLLRTLPNNKHYDNPNADGIPKLRRVLLAYSVHNPDVEYCQVYILYKNICLNFFYVKWVTISLFKLFQIRGIL